MPDYFVTLQLDSQRTQDVRIEAACAYDARMKYKNSGGKHRIIAIRPCTKEVSGTDQ